MLPGLIAVGVSILGGILGGGAKPPAPPGGSTPPGLDRPTPDGYDKGGYDKDGYNKDGFNRQGFDRAGLNRDGMTKEQVRKEMDDQQERREHDKQAHDKLHPLCHQHRRQILPSTSPKRSQRSPRAVASIWDSIKNVGAKAVDLGASAVGAGWQTTKDIVLHPVDSATKIGKVYGDALGSVYEGVTNKDNWNAIGKTLTDTATSIYKEITDKTNYGAAVTGVMETIDDIVKRPVDTAKKVYGTVVEPAVPIIKGILGIDSLEKIVDPNTPLIDRFGHVGLTIINVATSGFGSKGAGAIKAVDTAVDLGRGAKGVDAAVDLSKAAKGVDAVADSSRTTKGVDAVVDSGKAADTAADSAKAANQAKAAAAAPKPKAKEPAAPKPKTEEPPPPKPKAEEPPPPKPKAEEPAAPKPKAEEPPPPKPKAEEPAAPKPKAEEPPPPKPKAEEPAAPKPKAEEPPPPKPKAEEPPLPKPKANEAERLAKEAAQKERLAKEAEEAAEKQRLAKEALEKKRLAKEAEEAAEKQRLAKAAEEAAEKQRLAKAAEEAAEKQRLAKAAEEAAEKERLAKEAAEKAAKEAKEKAAEEARKKGLIPTEDMPKDLLDDLKTIQNQTADSQKRLAAILRLRRDTRSMRTLKAAADPELRRGFNKALKELVDKKHNDALEEWARKNLFPHVKPPKAPPKVEVKSFRTPKKAKLGEPPPLLDDLDDINADNDYRLVYHDDKGKLIEIDRRKWEGKSHDIFAETTGYSEDELRKVLSPSRQANLERELKDAARLAQDKAKRDAWARLQKEEWDRLQAARPGQKISADDLKQFKGNYSKEKLENALSPDDLKKLNDDAAHAAADAPENVKKRYWAEEHGQTPTDKYHPEASDAYSDQIKDKATGAKTQKTREELDKKTDKLKEVSDPEIDGAKAGKNPISDPGGLGEMYREKMMGNLRKGNESEAIAQAKKAVETMEALHNKAAGGFYKDAPPLPEKLQQAMDLIKKAPTDVKADPAALIKALDALQPDNLKFKPGLEGFANSMSAQFEALKWFKK